jgi:hypothetical protein
MLEEHRMAGTSADVAAVLAAVVTQVKKLTAEQVEALVAGTAEFKFVPKSLSRQFTQLTKLTDDQLQQLATGEATYALVPQGSKVTKNPPPKTAPPSAVEIKSKLTNAESEQAAKDYLDSLKLKPAEWKAVAQQLDVPTGTGPAIMKSLIKVYVTGRLTTAAVRF